MSWGSSLPRLNHWNAAARLRGGTGAVVGGLVGSQPERRTRAAELATGEGCC
jgi:hypothetical protein